MSKILEGNIIKKANIKQSYTKKEIEELRKCSAASENGHYYFLENFGFLKHPSQGRMLFKPFDYQYKLIDNYHNYRFSISMLGRQMGKATAFDTPIMTVDGFKTMEDIRIGDVVYNEMGDKVTVTYKTEKQLGRPCYKITFSPHDAIVADSEHQWRVFDPLLNRNAVFTTKSLIERLLLNNREGNSLSIEKFSNDTVEIFTIVSIEEDESVPTYCIEVDGDSHMFLAGHSQIPTHNCTTDETLISLRNKKTGEIMDMPIGEFYSLIKNKVD